MSPRKIKGFTFIEMIVATTLLVILTSMAATTAYNFIQSVTSFRAQFESLRDSISGLYSTVSLAKMTYEADLAFAVANGVNNPNDPNAQEAQKELNNWNSPANQSNPANLINVLLNQTPNIKKSSYLPTSLLVQFWTHDNNANAVQSSETVQITDYDSLLRAFLLTDKRTPDPSDTIVATLTLGRILDVANHISPTLPQIDWRRGTMQEILFPRG
jgi:prepilin-type N-terminal cleavage/methylation domain-containing protein